MNNIRMFYEVDYPRLHPDLDIADASWKFEHLFDFLTNIDNCDSMDRYPVILDIGCGCGKVLQDAASFLKGRPVGLDFSLSILSRAKKIFPAAGYIQAMAETLPIRLEKIDLVYFTDLLEHLEYPLKFLQGLKEARRLLVCIPLESGFLSDLVYRYQMSKGKVTNRHIYGHLHRYNRKNCLDLLKQAGLKPKYYKVVRSKKHPYGTRRGKIYGFFSEACFSLSPAIHQWLFGSYTLMALCKRC